MEQFFSGKAIAEKLLQLMAKIPYMQKDVDSKELRYKYLSYEAVSDRVQEELVALKVVSIPQFETVEQSNYNTAKGATWKYIRSKVYLQVIDVETGEYCTSICEGSGTDPGDKAVAKAQTMAMKNAWCKLLNIPIGNDPEADPRTDQQQFTLAQPFTAAAAPPFVPAQQVAPPFIPAPQPFTVEQPFISEQPARPIYGFPAKENEIIEAWNKAGWDPNGLLTWVQNRFGKAPAQLMFEECKTIIEEFKVFAQKKFGGQ
jgi:hypothetical protein